MRNLLCVLSLFVMLGCDKSNNARTEAALAEVPDEAFEEHISDEILAMHVDPHSPPPEYALERKLIQNGSLRFEVGDIRVARGQIMLLTDAAGGYIASEKHENNGDQPRYEQTVRIPGDKLNEFIASVESLASKIEDKNFSAQDVTEEFVDLEGRLTVQKELEARFREIVKQAKTVKDILEVEEQIGIVRSEIEMIQGRLKYLSNKVAYSSITLIYYQPVTTQPVVSPGIGSKFAASFIGGWDALVGSLVALTRAWPFLVIISVSTWLIIRRKRKEPKQQLQPQ